MIQPLTIPEVARRRGPKKKPKGEKKIQVRIGIKERMIADLGGPEKVQDIAITAIIKKHHENEDKLTNTKKSKQLYVLVQTKDNL